MSAFHFTYLKKVCARPSEGQVKLLSIKVKWKEINLLFICKCFCDQCVMQMVRLRLKGILVYRNAHTGPRHAGTRTRTNCFLLCQFSSTYLFLSCFCVVWISHITLVSIRSGKLDVPVFFTWKRVLNNKGIWNIILCFLHDSPLVSTS